MNTFKLLAGAVLVAAHTLVAAAAQDESATTETASADPSGFHASAAIDFMSKYMWRGTICNDRPCWQPSATIGYQTEAFGDFYASVWSSLDLTHRVNRYGAVPRRHGGMQELDYALGYAQSFGDLDLDLSHWFYTYQVNDNGKDYNEIILCATYNTPIVTPGVEIVWAYQDMNGFDQNFYFNFFVQRKFELFCPELTLTPKASLGFGDAGFMRTYTVDWKEDGSDGDGAQLTDQTTSLALSYALTEHLSITLSICYTWTPSHTLRDERYMTYGHDSRSSVVWGGISLGATF